MAVYTEVFSTAMRNKYKTHFETLSFFTFKTYLKFVSYTDRSVVI